MTYPASVREEICRRIANGESLRSICESDGMPTKETVRLWLASDDKGFLAQYARAREDQADFLAEEILEIADDARNDWMKQNDEDNEGWRENGEAIRRSQLRIDARKWYAGKLRPKVYGDKVDHNVGGNVTVQIVKYADDPASS